MMNITQSACLALTSLALTVAMGCDGSGVVSMDDAGVPADAAPLTDAGDDFDPSITYPGEGEPCEFSLFCAERQMCVDGECVRHERFEPDDLVLGEAVRIPHELFRTSSLYTEAARDWDTTGNGLELYGRMLPGLAGPTLAFFEDFGDCQVAIYGEGPPRVVSVPELRCATVGVSPDGYILLGGMNADRLNRYGKWALVGPDGELVTQGGYDGFEARVREATDNPEVRLYSMTSILWHEDRFLFSASASPPSDVMGGTLALGGPRHPTHTFFGSISIDGEVDLREVGDAVAHGGSFGWIVRDEDGLHSLLTVFNSLLEPTDVRIDLLTWRTGERETLVHGVAGQVAGTSRYFQPHMDRWGLAALQVDSRCSQELFEGTEHVGSIWSTPEEYCSELPVGVLAHQNVLGSSAASAAAFSGGAAMPWIAADYRNDDRAPVLLDGNSEEVVDLSEMGPAVEEFDSINAISRFGRTFEVFMRAANRGDPRPRLSCWEFRLSRGGE